MRYLILAVLLIGAGCDPAPDADRALRRGPQAEVTKRLQAESDVPLEWSGVARLGDTLIVAAAKSPEVWRIPLDSGAPERLFDDKRSGLAISGVALRGKEFGLHRRNGDLSVVDARGAPVSRHESAANAMSKPLAVAAYGDHWLTASMVTAVNAMGQRRGAVVLESIDRRGTARRIFEELQWVNDEFWSRAFDLRGATFSGDSALLTGIEPPRIVVHRISTGATDTMVLQDVPEREISPAEREKMDRSLQGVPDVFRKQLVLPRFQPPVVAAWPHFDGLFVMAFGPDQEPILDWYCDGRFQRTLIEDPALTEMFRAGDDIITVAEGADRDYEMRLYRIANLRTECP